MIYMISVTNDQYSSYAMNQNYLVEDKIIFFFAQEKQCVIKNNTLTKNLNNMTQNKNKAYNSVIIKLEEMINLTTHYDSICVVQIIAQVVD